MKHQRRHARNNPGSAGGILLTFLGLGIAAFSGFELLTGGKPFTTPGGAAATTPAAPAPPGKKPAPPPPKLTAHASAPPAPPTAPGAPTAGGMKPPTQQQVQQAVQAGQAIVSGAESLFGGSGDGSSSTSAPVFGDGSSPSAPVDADS